MDGSYVPMSISATRRVGTRSERPDQASQSLFPARLTRQDGRDGGRSHGDSGEVAERRGRVRAVPVGERGDRVSQQTLEFYDLQVGKFLRWLGKECPRREHKEATVYRTEKLAVGILVGSGVASSNCAAWRCGDRPACPT